MEKTVKKQSISTRLLGIVSLIMAAALLLLTIVSAVSMYSLSVTENENGLRITTQSLSKEIDTWVSEVKLGVLNNAMAGEQFFKEFADKAEAKRSFGEYLSRVYKGANGEYSEVYAGFTDGESICGSGWEPPADFDIKVRPWYTGPMASPGSVIVTEPYYSIAGDTVALSFATTVGKGTDIGCSVIDVTLAAAEKLIDEANAENKDTGMQSFIMGPGGDVYIIEDENFKPDSKTGEFKNLSTYGGGIHADILEGVKSGKFFTAKVDGVDFYYASAVMSETGWYVVSEVAVSEVLKETIKSVITLAVLFVLALTAAVVILSGTVKHLITKPITNIQHVAHAISLGKVGEQIPTNYVGELGALAVAFNEMTAGIKCQSDVLLTISQGDYTGSIEVRSDSDVLNESINHVVTKMNGTFHSIHKATGDVAMRAGEISDVSGQLSQATSEQAATVQELSASITEIHAKTSENTVMAQDAAALAESIKVHAEKGSHQMSEMTKAVEEINKASHDISRVIKVIDDIAFQTNILALNAAVEAARAGEAGKGFAVVADEVRNLASKSAAAAKETSELIENSMKKAEAGATIANETAASLSDIVTGINESTQLISKIAESGAEQDVAISQIDAAIQQVSETVSLNSATAEESAAYSEELNDLSVMLENQLKEFKLK